MHRYRRGEDHLIGEALRHGAASASDRGRRQRRGLRPTREGFRVLLLLFIIGFASFNTRNNLLYLMFSVGLAAIAVSVAGSWLSLRKLAVEPGGPSDFYAGTSCRERFRMRNDSRWLDGYHIEVEELDFPGKTPRGIIPHLEHGKTAVFVLEKLYPRRGVFATQRMHLSTRFPFGLFRCSREIR
ncbi:MAG: hypothetical protein ACE5JI_21760, partial [Acidobacteriota bacterium]